jgi:hypothetical protein
MYACRACNNEFPAAMQLQPATLYPLTTIDEITPA